MVDSPGERLPDSYGDVTGEYLSVRREAALVRGMRELVWVRGSDAVSFLQDLVTQEVEARPAGYVDRSLLLAPQGKLRAVFWQLRGDTEVGLLADVGSASVLVEDLNRFRIRVEVEILRDVRRVLEVWGPGAPAVLGAAGLTIPRGWERSDSVVLVEMPLDSLPRYAVIGVPADLLERSGARPAGRLAVTAVRVEGGEPQMGRDLDYKTIPQESGLATEAISFTKGCYLGQELVARIETRGHVNRLLRAVTVETNVLPPERAEIHAAGRMAGALTSVAESLTLRSPVGLSLMRREVEPGDEVMLRWEDVEAPGRAHAVPLADFTQS